MLKNFGSSLILLLKNIHWKFVALLEISSLITIRMALHLLELVLITITTTITNIACGELFLKMPLTINPVAQDIITERNPSIWKHVYGQDPVFFSRFTPADIVIQLNHSLAFVMRSTIVGALVLGAASKSAGLQTDHLKYQADNKWTVNVSLTDIKSVLNETEKYLLPLSDDITVTALQKFGLRVLEKRFNVSLGKIAKPLHLSTAVNFQSIQNDWIQVVKFITKINVNRLAAKYQVSVTTLAGALNLTLSQLYGMNLNQLDELLSKKFQFVKGSFEVIVPTLMTSTVETTLRATTQTQTSPEEKSTVSGPSTESSTTPTQSLTTSAANQFTDKTIALSFSSTSSSLKTSGVARPTNDSSSGTTTTNLALFVGVAVGLLLLLVASSTVWCFKRKRRTPVNNEKKKPNNNDNIKMNNFWVEKSDSEPASTQDEPRQEVCFLRSPSGSTTGFDSRFKGLYVSRSSTFIPDVPRNMINSIPDFENDTRREIFV